MPDTFDGYRNAAGVNWSTLKLLDDSPLHYRHAVEHPDEGNTASRGMLRAVHCLVLEPERFEEQFSIFDGVRRGKLYDAHVIAHEDTTVLNPREHNQARAIAAAVLAHPVASSYLRGTGRSEVTLRWTDDATGLPCKGRADRIALVGSDEVWIIDLKTVGSVDARDLGRMAHRMLWHGQLAHYLAGARAMFAYYGGRRFKAAIVAVEDKPPHDVGVFVLDDATLEAGESMRRSLLASLAVCRAADEWPGRHPELTTLEFPEYGLPEMEVDDDTPDTEDHTDVPY